MRSGVDGGCVCAKGGGGGWSGAWGSCCCTVDSRVFFSQDGSGDFLEGRGWSGDLDGVYGEVAGGLLR